MKHPFLKPWLAAGLLIGGLSVAQAQNLWGQERTSPESNGSSTNGKTVMVSGCLIWRRCKQYSIRAAG